VLKELVGLLSLDDKAEQTLVKMLKRRETLGSTGIGHNIAIPHCRALAVNRLRVAFGRKLEGVDFNAIDGKPVNYFFLIVAPPLAPERPTPIPSSPAAWNSHRKRPGSHRGPH